MHGLVEDGLTLTAEMDDGGVCFGDGIESDHLVLSYGQVVTVSRATTALELVA